MSSNKLNISKIKFQQNKKTLFVGAMAVILLSILGYSFLIAYRSNNANASSNNWTNLHFNNTTMKVCTYTSTSNTPRIRVKVHNPTSQVRWAQLIVNTVNVGSQRQHQYQRIEPADFNKVKDYPDRSGGVPRTFYLKVNIGVDERTRGINYSDINRCDSPIAADAVVRVATNEYNAYGNRNLENNGFYHKYTQGRNEPWCGHFIDWVFSEANREFPPSAHTASVAGLRSYYESTNRFRLKGSGYRPKAGDIAIYQNNMSHANIVVSVSGNSYTAIGGNESDGIRRSTYSLSGANLTGFGVN